MAQINDHGSSHNRIEVNDGALIPNKGNKGLFSSWQITFFGAIAILILLPVIKPDPYWEIICFIPGGILVTFEVTILAILFATMIGLMTYGRDLPCESMHQLLLCILKVILLLLLFT